MPDRPVDLAKVREALAGLDDLAQRRPDLVGTPTSDPEAVAAILATLEDSVQNDRSVTFRLPSALVKRIDAYAEVLREQTPGMRVSRTDAVRVLLTMSLDRHLPEGR